MKKKKNITLQQRILYTISLLAIVEVGSFISLPFVDRNTLLNNNTLTDALTAFSSGGRNSYHIFSVGIIPYLNASIVVQILTTLIPSLAKLQKEEGEYGQRKIKDLIRYLSVFLAILQSINLTQSLKRVIFNWNFWTATQLVLILITGSMIVLWLSELITRKGVGNGASLLICINTVANLASNFYSFYKKGGNVLPTGLTLLGIFLLLNLATVAVFTAIYRIKLISARQLSKSKSEWDDEKTILPLRMNLVGVMPLVFTSYIMVILSFFGNKIKTQPLLASIFGQTLFNNGVLFWVIKIAFWMGYCALIYFFTSIYANIVFDSKDMASKLRKNSVIIEGITPGKPTRFFLKETLKEISKLNAIFLIGFILLLQLVSLIPTLNNINFQGLGLTSQLIFISVILETSANLRLVKNEN